MSGKGIVYWHFKSIYNTLCMICIWSCVISTDSCTFHDPALPGNLLAPISLSSQQWLLGALVKFSAYSDCNRSRNNPLHIQNTLNGDEIIWEDIEEVGQLQAPRYFIPGKRAPGTHWIGGWMGPRASFYMVLKRKNCCPCWESNPSHPAHSLVTILTELPQLSIYHYKIGKIINNSHHTPNIHETKTNFITVVFRKALQPNQSPTWKLLETTSLWL
jgi:hypothetical protein